MIAMNDNAARILAEPVTGTLSIAGSDGYAHSTPVWFVWRDGKIWVSTAKTCRCSAFRQGLVIGH